MEGGAEGVRVGAQHILVGLNLLLPTAHNHVGEVAVVEQLGHPRIGHGHLVGNCLFCQAHIAKHRSYSHGWSSGAPLIIEAVRFAPQKKRGDPSYMRPAYMLFLAEWE